MNCRPSWFLQVLTGSASSETCTSEVSVRRFSSYGLLKTQHSSTEPEGNVWYQYTAPGRPGFNMSVRWCKDLESLHSRSYALIFYLLFILTMWRKDKMLHVFTHWFILHYAKCVIIAITCSNQQYTIHVSNASISIS